MYGSAVAPTSPSGSFGPSSTGAGQVLPPRRCGVRAQGYNSRSPPQHQYYGRGGGTSSSSSIAADISVVRRNAGKRGREGMRDGEAGDMMISCDTGASANVTFGGSDTSASVPMTEDDATVAADPDTDGCDRSQHRDRSEKGRAGLGVARPFVGLVRGLRQVGHSGCSGVGFGADGSSSSSSAGIDSRAPREEVECAICMETVVRDVVKLPCGHLFCANCVGEIYSGRNATRDKKGRSSSKKCPLCRAQPPWWWWWWW
mmetsp:Transcript_34870/g.59989  ORF Transcript_34870/g.59989 Transcript_34870/m.59989 type:complete len:258 (-) Transcript_34870:94-867(-)